jgi:hypothetical protein
MFRLRTSEGLGYEYVKDSWIGLGHTVDRPRILVGGGMGSFGA